MTPSLINTCGNRFYRRYMGAGKNTVSLKYRDSDIWISYSSNKKILKTEFKTFLKNRLYELRNSLEDYCQKDNEFRDSLLPVGYRHNAPDMAKAMAELSFVSKVGPMAGVAGAFAMYLGRFCREEFDLESIIVENGGDLYISSPETVNAVLYAGENVLSGKLALSIPPKYNEIGLCASSGCFGPSKSFGSADLVAVACKNTILADQYATHFANMIKTKNDVVRIVDIASAADGVLSVVAIKEDTIAIKGEFGLVPA